MAPSISLCVILLELSEDSPSVPNISYKAPKYFNKPSPGGLESKFSDELKFGVGDKLKARGLRTPVTFTVQTFEVDDQMDEELEKDLSDDGGAASQVSPNTTLTDSDGPTKKINFFSGNSFVEITKGIIHMYKENERTPMDTSGKSAPSDMLVMLSIPTYISCTDLLQFLAPFQKDFSHIRVIRENSPNQYMALLQCKSEPTADMVYNALNGAPYSNLEEEVCKVAFVSRVESLKGEGGIGLPLLGHTELPTCPVCLERMDESVDGILTILCNHTFHSGCLAKWSDSRCPVCRYVQTPEMVAKNVCFECSSSESLWICLICGHIGCGRYVHGHAYKHFCETSHCYAIQPDNNRVWDYAGDNFVHRLLQNKDGKLVEVNRRGNEEDCDDPEDKTSHLQLEFTYMLTTQLESQRHYFEQSLEEQAKQFRQEVEKLQLKLAETSDRKQELEHKYTSCVKENSTLENELTQVSEELPKLAAELQEEKDLTKHLQRELQKWQEMVKRLESDVEKLKKEKKMEEQAKEEQAKEFRQEVEKLQLKLMEISDKKKELENKFTSCSKEKAALERKFNQVSQKLTKLAADLEEERDLNKHLQMDQQKWQEMIKKMESDAEKFKKEKTAEINDLQEQLRDIMFYMDAQRKIEESPLRSELVDGQVTVDKSEAPSTSKGRRKKRN